MPNPIPPAGRPTAAATTTRAARVSAARSTLVRSGAPTASGTRTAGLPAAWGQHDIQDLLRPPVTLRRSPINPAASTEGTAATVRSDLHDQLLRPEARQDAVATHDPCVPEGAADPRRQRGPRVLAPAGAPARERYEGTTLLSDDDAVFYRMPIDTFDEDGLFVSRVTRPVTRKAVESMFTRIKRHLPWAVLHGLRPHDIRHTSSVIVDKASDHQLTQLHLAHDAANTTEHYLPESLAELAEVKERIFGDAADARQWATARLHADQHDPDDDVEY